MKNRLFSQMSSLVLGVAILFGHSCHVFQGIEIYKDRPILYSCGDFIDDYAVDSTERNDQSFIFTVEITDGSVCGLRLYPTVIRDFRALCAPAEEARYIVQKMQALCREMGTDSAWMEEAGGNKQIAIAI